SFNELQANLSSPKLRNCYQSRATRLLQKYVAQDHQFIKRLVEAEIWFSTLTSKKQALRDYEKINRIRKNDNPH
ncbi:MAG TPA: hypothetical protein VE956_13430, partial [Nodularia sp. (in: cyanobacteria)]|nr:hypothetical protein [Nodularia sp. (in: cyanobacteria)]